jgi:hypothetical protein
MGADVAGHTADRAAAAAADQAASYPRTLTWTMQGAQGTAMQPLFTAGGGTRGFMHSQPRLLAKGNAGSVGIAYNGTAPAATVEAGQVANPRDPALRGLVT